MLANIRIALNSIKKIDLLNTGGMAAAEVWSKYKPDYLMNLALYDTDTKTTIANMLDEGKRAGYLFSTEGIGIRGSRGVVWTDLNDKAVRDFVSGAPVLVKNGAKHVDWGNKKSDYINGKHMRTALGFNDRELILYCSDMSLTIDNLVKKMQGFSAKYAINLDGGGSQHLQDRKKTYKKSTRKNASWLLVYLYETKTKTVTETAVHHDGETLNSIIVDGVTYAPVRALAEMLGKTVRYDAETKETSIV